MKTNELSRETQILVLLTTINTLIFILQLIFFLGAM